MNRRFLTLLLAGCLIGSLGASRAEAQDVRTLSVRDGKVYVDGVLVPPAELPVGLTVAGRNLQLSFVGEGRPVLELDGRLFRLDGHRLVEVDRSDASAGNVSVFFRDRARVQAAPGAAVWSEAPQAPRAAYEAAPEAGVYTFEVRALPQVEQLEAQAQALSSLSRKLEATAERTSAGHVAAKHDLNQLVHEVQKQAEQNVRLARVLPGLEVQRYLEQVQARDQALYKEIHRELLLEAETRELAARVKTLPEGPARTEHIARLRKMLGESFELKQANRRREIAQLEERLDQLQVRLHERENLREDLVERRLQELLQEARPEVW